jgi:acetyl-CoA C-acetyltransferase
VKPVYIAAYHQSVFGKLMDMSVPEIVANAVSRTCQEIGTDASSLDVASIGAACNVSLNEQGLLAGLVAQVPGLGGKPIESVENACASGGQAVLSVVQKLQCGLGETGIALGYEKMRDGLGKMDGKLVGKVLGYFSHPDERPGKVFVFPHLFAEVMDDYLKTHGYAEEDLAAIAVQEYRNAKHNPYAQMRNVDLTVEKACQIEGINRYVAEGLRLKTFDCSQITDGYAGLIVATEEGLGRLGLSKKDCVRIAGWGQATDPLRKEGRDVLRPRGAYAAMNGAEVIGKAPYGEGARYWVDGKAAPSGECGINTSGGLIAKGHPIGATGVAMIGWCAWQLLGKAPGELQVRGARAAATFNIGGPICASVCTVLTPGS